MKKIDTYIFVHDQEIIIDFLSKKRFSDFNSFKYVFLSNRPTDKIVGLDNLIICKDLEHNIESYPKFTSFTGWYALVKNNLIESEYVNFFEYDINYIEKFPIINKDLIDENFDFIGYFPMFVSDPVYVKQRQYSQTLVDSLRKKNNLDIYEMISEIEKKNSFSVWSSSSNSTWNSKILTNYVNWFSDFINDLKYDNFCGHIHERSISFYYFINNLNVKNTTNLMTHYQLNTHGTSPLPKNRFQDLYPNLK